ncbi:hypothetical protein [Ursidibacter sp. B-7004-1]
MKSILIDFTGYTIIFGSAHLYYRNVLTSQLSFNWQIFLLTLLIGAFALIYHYAKNYIEQLYTSSIKKYLICLCVLSIALSSLSHTELQQLGFQFSTDDAKSIHQYLQLKCLFFMVGIVIFPKLFRE